MLGGLLLVGAAWEIFIRKKAKTKQDVVLGERQTTLDGLNQELPRILKYLSIRKTDIIPSELRKIPQCKESSILCTSYFSLLRMNLI